MTLKSNGVVLHCLNIYTHAARRAVRIFRYTWSMPAFSGMKHPNDLPLCLECVLNDSNTIPGKDVTSMYEKGQEISITETISL